MTHLLNALAQTVALTLAAAARRTSTLTGSAVDVLDYEGVATVILNASAAVAGTNPTLDVKVQHSDTTTSGDFADVTGGAFTQVTDAASLQVLKLNVSALKRYLRVIGTIGGTSTPTFDFSVEFIGIKKAS